MTNKGLVYNNVQTAIKIVLQNQRKHIDPKARDVTARLYKKNQQ